MEAMNLTSSRPRSRWFQVALIYWVCAVVVFVGAVRTVLPAQREYEPKPTHSYFIKFNPIKAPAPGPLLLKEGDRLAIIGDSITEQKMYSRIIEDYLTVCVPQLKVTARQFGWSGEKADGFLHRMDNDCLRFHPTVGTLCYGMNDHLYRPFDLLNSERYHANYTAVVQALKTAGARVVLGAPGCVGKVPSWTKSEPYSMDELNVNLCAFRDIALEIAEAENVRFADVFWTMFKAGYEGHTRFDTPDEPFMVSGKDGVHPGWAGQLVMAYTFLRAMGLDGLIGTYTVNLDQQTAAVTAGHEIVDYKNGVLTVNSTRYPFCAAGAANRDDSIRAGMELVPFNQQLNRLMLIVTGGSAANYKVTWGTESKTYSAAELSAGVNLASDFVVNPFSEAFNQVDAAVKAKQEYETTQIKKIFHGPEGKADMERAVEETEATRAPLAAAIQAAFVPVKHTLTIQPAD